MRLRAALRRLGRGRFEPLEIWGSNRGEGDGSKEKKLLVRMPEQLQGRRRGGKRLTRCEFACNMCVCVCACVS